MDVAIVLHSHLPRLARNGTFPAGEQWLHEAITESYLPVLDVLERLGSAGLRDLVSVGVTPVLAEQLADPYVLDELHGWTGRRLLDLQYTVSRYAASDRERLWDVWAHDWRRWQRTLDDVALRSATGLLAPLSALADAGVVELLGGPATHPYLPLMTDEVRLRAQLADGMAAHSAWSGRVPRGVWTPECGYRPEGEVGDPTRPPGVQDGIARLQGSGIRLPGLEALWEEAGASHLVLDGSTLAEGAGARPRDWGGVGAVLPGTGSPLDAVDQPVRVGDSGLVAFGRNLPVSYAVWSPTGGYPGDPAYRDFHTVDLEGGFKAWRVTMPPRDGSLFSTRPGKQPYEPVHARERAVAHADAFVALLRRYAEGRDAEGVIVAAYDTELFGHWWHEGPVWLERVLRRLAADPVLRPTTLEGHLERRRAPPPRTRLPESSWGTGKRHASWATEATRPMWLDVTEAQALHARRRRAASAEDPRVATAARQLELLEASDWPFMVARGQAGSYGRQRAAAHRARFDAAWRGESLEQLHSIDGRPLGAAADPAAG